MKDYGMSTNYKKVRESKYYWGGSWTDQTPYKGNAINDAEFTGNVLSLQFQTINYASVDKAAFVDVSEIKKSERQENILVIVNKSPTISGRKMSEMLSVSQRTIERDLATQKKLRILQHKGKDNDGEWIVTESGLKVLAMKQNGTIK